MQPEIESVPAFVIGWSLATLIGGGAAIALMRRAGVSRARAGVVLVGLIAAILIGSKILFLFENAPAVFASRTTLRAALYSAHMRIPGGFALMILITPLLARLAGARTLALIDAFIPAAGLALCGIRIGCFVEGCCFGTPSKLPWAVRFPAASSAFWWQVEQGMITLDAHRTVPVHPLQIYFGLAGLVIFFALFAYQGRKRYDGEVLLLFVLSFLWSTWLLELLRASPHEFTRHFVLAAGIVATALAAGIEWRRAARRTFVPGRQPVPR